jgi:fibronectin type 3 domain-containing protein
MNTRPCRRCALVYLALICLVLAASCGRKTDPLTPPSPRPEAVKDVRAVERDAVAFLSWSIPTKNVEGKDMNPSEIFGFRVFRAEIGREGKRARYRLVAEINLSKPAPAEVRSGRVYWSDPNLRYGHVYGYRIRAMGMRGGMSQPSEEVRVAPLLSLAAPKTLNAVGGDSNNQLSWDPVNTRSDGSTYEGFVGYNVYRGTEKGWYDETPLNKEPLRTNTYKDTAVVNKKTYYYMVRAVDSPVRPWKESLDSPEASAMPRDLTPPKRPAGLTVVPGVGRIFLTWNENRERDLAGYFVYRSTKSRKEFERLTDKPINRTTFSDDTVAPRILYYYAVTAVDDSGNESPMSKEQKAFAEKLR